MIDEKQFNPWISMWTKPRKTIQRIIDTNPTDKVIFLAIVFGVTNILDQASRKNLGDSMGVIEIFALAIVGGAITGIFGLYFFAFLLRWTGDWIGGKANDEQIRAAYVWSNIPAIVILILWVPHLLLFGGEMFTSEMPSLIENPFLSYYLYAMLFVEMILGIWSLALYLVALAQVQGFSIWTAIGNNFLAAMVIAIPIIIFILISKL